MISDNNTNCEEELQEFNANCHMFDTASDFYVIPNFNDPEWATIIPHKFFHTYTNSELESFQCEIISVTTTARPTCSFFVGIKGLSVLRGSPVFNSMYFKTPRKVIVIVPISFSSREESEIIYLGDMIIQLSVGNNKMECLTIANIKNAVKDHMPLRDNGEHYKSGIFYLNFNGELRPIKSKQQQFPNKANLDGSTWIIDENPSDSNYHNGDNPTSVFLNFTPALAGLHNLSN